MQLGSEEVDTSKADCATNSRMQPLKEIGVEARLGIQTRTGRTARTGPAGCDVRGCARQRDFRMCV